jgi:hypothetical protein
VLVEPIGLLPAVNLPLTHSVLHIILDVGVLLPVNAG